MPCPKVDLVVSAGGETQMPNICVSRFLGIPSIFCGSLLRGLEPENFDLIVSSYDRDAGSPRHIVVLKPSSIDPDVLGRPKVVPRYGTERRPKLAGLLIGGNAGPFRYRPDEWDRLLAFAAEISKTWGTRWLISTSRRTPDYVGDKIAALAKDESVVVRFIDFRTAGPGTLPELFAKAEIIVCTEDSSTMVSEAVSARLPVVGVAPAALDLPTRSRLIAAFSSATIGAACCRSPGWHLKASPARFPRSSRSSRTRSTRWPQN
jgi:uncharacterized protein